MPLVLMKSQKLKIAEKVQVPSGENQADLNFTVNPIGPSALEEVVFRVRVFVFLAP
jgi:hypothetical protein